MIDLFKKKQWGTNSGDKCDVQISTKLMLFTKQIGRNIWNRHNGAGNLQRASHNRK